MTVTKDPNFHTKILEQMNLLQVEKSRILSKIQPWLEKLTNSHLSDIEKRQKEKEIIDVGHFLYYLDKNIDIQDAITEIPDFIVESNSSLIGIELKDFIIKYDEKEKEGNIKTIFKQIIKELKLNLKEYCGSYRVEFINEKFSLNRNSRENIKNEILSLIKGNPINNIFIKHITKQPYNGIALHIGETTIAGNIQMELVQEKIESKEKMVNKYKQGKLKEIWLLLVIGGVEKSSNFCFFDSEITEKPFRSNFDRIFIYEFFDRKITELKITSHNTS